MHFDLCLIHLVLFYFEPREMRKLHKNEVKRLKQQFFWALDIFNGASQLQMLYTPPYSFSSASTAWLNRLSTSPLDCAARPSLI